MASFHVAVDNVEDKISFRSQMVALFQTKGFVGVTERFGCYTQSVIFPKRPKLLFNEICTGILYFVPGVRVRMLIS